MIARPSTCTRTGPLFPYTTVCRSNAGVPVLLLDIVPEGAPQGTDDRSALARGAIAKMLKADPAPFMWQRAAGLVTPGNLEDDIDKLADCDWIVEAVLEDPEVKRDQIGREHV